MTSHTTGSTALLKASLHSAQLKGTNFNGADLSWVDMREVPKILIIAIIS
ncbi:pentapeptide repeat-containing protein [Ktedonospora formicarum]